MCRAVTCKTCDKITWSGCGMHVDQVLAPFPLSARCPGHPDHPRLGFFARLLRRR